MAIINGRSTYRDTKDTRKNVTPGVEATQSGQSPDNMSNPMAAATQLGTTAFNPRVRAGAAPIEAVATTPLEAPTLASATDMINAEAEAGLAEANAVPVEIVPEPDSPDPIEAPEVEEAPTTSISDIESRRTSIKDDLKARMESIKAEPISAGAIQQETQVATAAANAQLKQLDDEQSLAARLKAQLGKDFTQSKLEDRITGVMDIADKQNVDLNVAEGLYNRQVSERAKLDPAAKESYDRIISRFDNPDFNQEDAYKTAIAEYEADGVDADDMQKAKDAVASRYGQNFADEMEDEYLINDRKVDKAIVENDRKLIDTRKLGETIKSGQGDARITNSYLKTLNEIAPELVPDAMSKILASDATQAAKRQAAAFAKDFYTDVDTGIGQENAENYDIRTIGNQIVRVNKATGKAEPVFTGKDTPSKQFTTQTIDGQIVRINAETGEADVIFGTPKTEEESADYDFNKLSLEEKESVLRAGKLAFGTRISDKEGEKVLSIVADPENKGKDIFEISARILGYKPLENKGLGDVLLRRLSQNLGKDEGLSVYPLDSLSTFLTEGNLSGAVNLTEKLVADRAKEQEGDDYISEAFTKRTVKKMNEVQGLLDKVRDDELKIGNFDGTIQQWLGKFKGTDETELGASITSAVAEMRNKLLGSAVTPAEEAFLADLLPGLDDRADQLVVKLDRLKEQGMIDLNSQRSTYALPELSEGELLDVNERAALYKSREELDEIGRAEDYIRETFPDAYAEGDEISPEDIAFAREQINIADTIPETAEESAEARWIREQYPDVYGDGQEIPQEHLDFAKAEIGTQEQQPGGVQTTQDAVASVEPKTPEQAATSATEFIKEKEGFREQAYQDSAGVWTIGYGTTKINGEPVKEGDTINQDNAEQEINKEITRLETEVDKIFGNSIDEFQKVALTSFMYNLGMNIFDQPEAQVLKEAIRGGDIDTIKEQWVQYINAGGTPIKGLQIRRIDELGQFLSSIN